VEDRFDLFTAAMLSARPVPKAAHRSDSRENTETVCSTCSIRLEPQSGALRRRRGVAENAGVENAGAITRVNPSEEIP